MGLLGKCRFTMLIRRRPVWANYFPMAKPFMA
jgi:hypothetical protein